MALSDESLDAEEAEEIRLFDRDGTGYGRSKASIRNQEFFEEEEFPEEDIDDLLTLFGMGDDE
ncbi:MAG: hypothetical protein LPK02_07320 [Rhodobacterales bacterium]|nr:hypothetical protein [Rhodobacterales bacterium]